MRTAILIAAAVCAAAPIFAQTSREPRVGDIVRQGDSVYYLVRVFSTPEQNAAFQRDLDIMRRHATAIDKCKLRLKEIADAEKTFEKDPKKLESLAADKKKISAALDRLVKDFSTNEEAMKKLYGFVSNRDYRVTYDESNICVPLTNDELSELKSKDGQKLDPLKIVTRGNTSLYVLKNISGARANEQLQRMLGFTISRKNEIEKLRGELAKTVDPQAQLKISASISAAEKAMQENEEKLRKTYGIDKNQNYSVEISKSKMYLIITPEEERELRAKFGG